MSSDLSVTNSTPYALSKVWGDVKMDLTVCKNRKSESTKPALFLWQRTKWRMRREYMPIPSYIGNNETRGPMIFHGNGSSSALSFFELQNGDGHQLRIPRYHISKDPVIIAGGIDKYWDVLEFVWDLLRWHDPDQSTNFFKAVRADGALKTLPVLRYDTPNNMGKPHTSYRPERCLPMCWRRFYHTLQLIPP